MEKSLNAAAGTGEGYEVNPPTAPMLSAARKIASARGLKLPPGLADSFDICRSFLDDVLSQPAPPTPKMRALAEQIAREDGLELGDALSTFTACKEFLDTHLENRSRINPPTERMLAAARAAAERRGIDLPKEVEHNFSACRAFLDAHPQP